MLASAASEKTGFGLRVLQRPAFGPCAEIQRCAYSVRYLGPLASPLSAKKNAADGVFMMAHQPCFTALNLTDSLPISPEREFRHQQRGSEKVCFLLIVLKKAALEF